MHLQAWIRCDHPWKLMPWPTPDNVFSRAVMPWPSRENPFTGAGALPAPANNIYSCKRQERVSLPPLQMLFYPPYKCFFVVVLEDAMWMPGLLLTCHLTVGKVMLADIILGSYDLSTESHGRQNELCCCSHWQPSSRWMLCKYTFCLIIRCPRVLFINKKTLECPATLSWTILYIIIFRKQTWCV